MTGPRHDLLERHSPDLVIARVTHPARVDYENAQFSREADSPDQAGVRPGSPNRRLGPLRRIADPRPGSILSMPATLADLEARVAALEAERADYRAVLAAVNALGANQRELTERVASVETRLGAVEAKLDDTGARVRSIEDGMAEVKDLLVRALDR